MANRPRQEWQFSLRGLLLFAFLVACAASAYRVFGVSSAPLVLGIAGAGAAYVRTRRSTRPRVAHPFCGFGAGAILGMFVIFERSYSRPPFPFYDERYFVFLADERYYVFVSLLVVAVLVYLVSALTITET